MPVTLWFVYLYILCSLTMYENVYGKTPPRFGENAVALPLDVDHPCVIINS